MCHADLAKDVQLTLLQNMQYLSAVCTIGHQKIIFLTTMFLVIWVYSELENFLYGYITS